MGGTRFTVVLDRVAGRWIYRLHCRLYELTGGRIGHRSPLGPILLLTTIGRRTGRPHTTPLLYLPDDGGYVVVASNGGRDEPPDWLRNLDARPDARVRAGRVTHRVRAEVLWGPDADILWPQLTAHYQGWQAYQRLTDREIPVVRLLPID